MSWLLSELDGAAIQDRLVPYSAARAERLRGHCREAAAMLRWMERELKRQSDEIKRLMGEENHG